MSDFLTLALARAKVRWCWDDAAYIEEQLAYCEVPQGMSPEQWVDNLAESLDLLDPKDFTA